MVITHAEHPALGYSVSQQIEAAQMGAWIEHSYNNIWFKRASLDEVYSQIWRPFQVLCKFKKLI